MRETMMTSNRFDFAIGEGRFYSASGVDLCAKTKLTSTKKTTKIT